MRGIVVLALLAVALTICLSAAARPSAKTVLTVTYWAKGQDAGKPVVWTLRCNPMGGTHPRPLASCRRLGANSWRLFRPLPKHIVCIEIYGGPQVARVVGIIAGRRVWGTFSRENGCAVERWSRISPWLLPPGGTT